MFACTSCMGARDKIVDTTVTCLPAESPSNFSRRCKRRPLLLLLEMSFSLASRITGKLMCNISTPPSFFMYLFFIYPAILSSLWCYDSVHFEMWNDSSYEVLHQYGQRRESPIFLKSHCCKIGRRLPTNTDVPPPHPPICPQALLGSRAHKLDKKSNFPVGFLGSGYSQPRCFLSGVVDFYSSGCKWADKQADSRNWIVA